MDCCYDERRRREVDQVVYLCVRVGVPMVAVCDKLVGEGGGGEKEIVLGHSRGVYSLLEMESQ